MTEHALSGIEESDFVACVLDGRQELTQEDYEWIQWTRSLTKPKVYIVNKIDEGKTVVNSSFYEAGILDFISMSAETGRGVSDLLDLIVSFVPKSENEVLQSEESTEFSVSETDSEVLATPKIALVGRPNVGKSTFFNALLGFERVVVDDTPGTTRDPIDSSVFIDGQECLFTDTAGLKKKGQTNEVIDKFSAMKTIKAIEHADYVFVLLSATEGITEQDAHVIGEAYKRNKALLILVNKWDVAASNTKRQEILDEIARKIQFAHYAPILFISAKNKTGFDKVFETFKQMQTEYERRVPTSELNRVFEQIVDGHPLPVHAGKNIKISFAAQTSVRPPTFVIFTNQPSHIHFSYERYLMNSLRKAFGFSRIPLRILFRKK